MPIKEARAADVAAMSDRSPLGASILVMRKWPRMRGFNKFSVDFWLPDLGPSLGLLYGYRDGLINWSAFAERYKAEQRAATTCRVVEYVEGVKVRDEVLQRSPMAHLRALEWAFGDATVICWEDTTCECHRFILQSMMLSLSLSNRLRKGVDHA